MWFVFVGLGCWPSDVVFGSLVCVCVFDSYECWVCWVCLILDLWVGVYVALIFDCLCGGLD